jgi:hypothetical protein
MRFAPHLVCLGLALLAPFACSSTPTTATKIVRPQLVAVDPDDFLLSVHCVPVPNADTSADDVAAGDAHPDAARSYVATLFDVTPDVDGGVPNPGIPLASSPPTTCVQPVTFSYVTAGHRYVAEVDAYDQFPDKLSPISPGSRLLSDAQGIRILPRWIATCGGYPPSPSLDAGTEAAGASGTDDDEARPPGVVSYTTITQTPHDCGPGLHVPD